MKKYKIIDLFSGIGGFSYGFLMNPENRFELILANDIWEPAIKTFARNHPDVPVIHDDIHNITKKALVKYNAESADIIIGGPPCQGFSMCGTRDEKDHRNTLFQEYARIVKLVKPKIFLMENVKGLLSMKTEKGEPVIDAIHGVFDDDYEVNYKVVNAAEFGVPQRRERVIIVGVLKNAAEFFSFPEGDYSSGNDSHQYELGFGKNPGEINVEEAINDLPEENSSKGELNYKKPKTDYQKRMRRGQKKIFNHELPIHNESVIKRMSTVPQGGNWQNIPEKLRVGGIHSNAYRRLDSSKSSVTIKHAFKSMIIHPHQNRCLTIREVARIQSFPDSFIFEDVRSTQYQQLANAVPPLLALGLSKAVIKYLDLTENKNKKSGEKCREQILAG